MRREIVLPETNLTLSYERMRHATVDELQIPIVPPNCRGRNSLAW